jgi:hypothetical protein
MLDTRSESHSGTNGFFEAADLAEPFPPLPANSQNPQDSQSDDNRLKKAMQSVDLLQALDELAADDRQQPRPGSLDDILLAELGPDADDDIPQAAAAIDRQLLLSRIVKARDAILAEEEQAARSALASRAAAQAEPEDTSPGHDEPPAFDSPVFDTDVTPAPPSPIREAITIRRLALAVSVTALCIAAGWTLRSGSLPGFDAAGNGQAQAAMASMAAAPLAMPRTAPRPVQQAGNAAAPVTATALAERMAPDGQPAAGVDDEAIKQRLMETHAQPQRQEIEAVPAPQAVTAAQPVALPVAPPQASVAQEIEATAAPEAAPEQVASADPVTQTDALPDISPEPPLPPDPEPVASTPPTRDPAAVETAMATSFGLDELAPAQRAALKDRLVAGECPSTALAALLGRAPVVATRDLVNNLENGC